MATLEKIRSKSVLLVVIIAVALLAFILGDAITNGRNLFGNNTTVAKVGGEKIEYQDYQRKQQELSQQIEEGRKQNPQQFEGFDSQILPQQALDQLIDETLAARAVEATGIQSSPELLRFYMIENPNTVLPEMQQLIMSMRQNGLNVSTPQEAYAVIFQPQSYGLTERQVSGFQQVWIALEGRYNQAIGQMIYGSLFNNSFKANKLDIAATKREYAAKANVKVAKKPYGQLDEKTYKVNDDEIKKAYEAQKELYALKETTKEIAFIAVDVPASATDKQGSEVLATTVVAELKKGGLSKETRKNGLDVQRHEMRLMDVFNPALKSFLQNAPIDSIAILPSSIPGFNIAKINKRSTDVDSIMISSIAVQGSKGLVEKVLAYANSGASLDSLSKKFSADSVMYQAPQWTALYSAQGNAPKFLGLQETLYDSLMNKNGSYMVIDQQEGMAVIAAITDKKAPKEIVEFETVDYVLHPSDATLAQARTKLEKFLAQNNTAEKFQKNAKAAGYNVVDMTVTPSTPAIPSGYGFYPDSRALVRWVIMDGKDGEVSKIYQDKDPANPSFYVAAVLDTYEDYIPWTNKQVKEQLTDQVRRDKAGDAMLKQYAKNTVEASAQAMQVEPVEDEVRSDRASVAVTDSKVRGRIMGTKNLNKVQSAKGDDGVYVFVVTGITEEPVQFTDDDLERQFLSKHRIDASAALRGNKKIENNAYKFEQPQ